MNIIQLLSAVPLKNIISFLIISVNCFTYVFQPEPMIGENQQLVTDEPVEVQDYRKITFHFRGIYTIYPYLIRENWGMSTCNWLDLQTRGSQAVMSKILLDHWPEPASAALCTEYNFV